jgi:hypothetical protein
MRPEKESAPANYQARSDQINASDRSTSQPRPPGLELVGMVALRLIADGHIELHAGGKLPYRVTRQRIDALGHYLADPKADIRQAIRAA